MNLKYFFLFCALIASNCSPSSKNTTLNRQNNELLKSVFEKAGLPLLSEKRNAANWSLKNLNGEKISLKNLAGKIVFLNFWTTWCPPCRGEMDSMEELYQKFKDKDFEMIACNIMEDAGDVKDFIRTHNLNFTVTLDSDGKTTQEYNVSGIPATFIIDREGMLILQSVGGRNWSTPNIHAAFEELLND